VAEEAATGNVLKYHELLKKAEKLLHTKTKHSKVSAIVNIYNLKCVGGVRTQHSPYSLNFSMSCCLRMVKPCLGVHMRLKSF
jgi:hypothetical protein